MKALWCGAAALTLVAAVSLSPAMAQGPKPSGGNTWPGISQRVVPSSSTAEECGSGRLWVSPGYASRGKWQPAHCASDAQVSEETGPKSSYGYTKSAGFAGFSGPQPSGGSTVKAERRHDKRPLRVAVRIRSPRKLEGSLGPGSRGIGN